MRKLIPVSPFAWLFSISNHNCISLTRKYGLVCNYEVMLPAAVRHSKQAPIPAIIYSLLFFHKKYTVIRYWSHSRCDELNKTPSNFLICHTLLRLAGINHDLKTNFKTFFVFVFFSFLHVIAIAMNTLVLNALMAPAAITYSVSVTTSQAPLMHSLRSSMLPSCWTC